MAFFLVILFVADLIYRLYRQLFPTPNISVEGKHVFITGCDSGFGHALALALDKQGFHVFAAVLNTNNQSDLQQKLSSNATVFQLDITKDEEVDNAYELVRKRTPSLHALVNNAGISTSGFLDWMDMDTMRRIMDVNFFGQVAMTKKFLPLLIAKRDSRVVNICSVAGFLTAPMKGAYSASKYALESFSDCLRREMAPWNLRVSIIEPGPMRTPIIEGHDQVMRRLYDRLPADIQARWGEDYLRLQMEKVSANFLYRYAEDPAKVVDALQHAVRNSKPEIRYRPGWQSKFFFLPLSMMPASWADKILSVFSGATVLPAGARKSHQD